MISAKTFAIAGTVLTLLAADARAFEIIGHRGARGLAPENTLAAFATGVAAGATAVEADAMVTRDHHVIVRHDYRVNPELCQGPYRHRLFRKLTLEQVRRLDCGRPRVAGQFAATQVAAPGSHIPALGQVYRLVPRRVRIVVEPKTDPYHPHLSFPPAYVARRVVETIRAVHGVRRTTVQSFDWRLLRAVARLEPRLRLQALASDTTFYRGSAWLGGVHTGHLPSAAHRAGFDALALPRSLVTRELMAGARRRHLEVLGYTIDAPATMRALMALGADGLITDYPDRLRRELRAIP